MRYQHKKGPSAGVQGCRTLMIQGTSSGVGKSLLVTALCRIFNNRGIRVAPFKAQNMALNSYITIDGGEIGRAQALQAEAARIEPSVDMNPVLLKASAEWGCQVIVHGKVFGHYSAKDYYNLKERLWNAVRESFERLSRLYELILIEGAGSPAEINLSDKEIVNMAVARYTRAPVILVGDIERGGVFASLYGTVRLLKKEAKYIKAFVINKFRGDPDILNPGLTLITELTGRPVIGVIPYIKDIGLPEEDGLALSTKGGFRTQDSRFSIEGSLRIVVVRLPYISNFTDFDPLSCEPDAELIYSNSSAEIENADILILPGTKNTVKDLLFLKESGLERSIIRAYRKGIQVIGICGGYQMLGKKIYDPFCVESNYKEIEGIGLLNIETEFKTTKITSQVEAELSPTLYFSAMEDKICPSPLRGYEIHKGQSSGDIGLFKIKRLSASSDIPLLDGSINGNCWGTYLHGIFDNDNFRRALLNSVRIKKGLKPVEEVVSYKELKERALDHLAGVMERSLNISFLKGLIYG